MVKYRVVYAILWLLAVIAYSLPWATVDGQTFVGWNFTIPFSITYLIGLILGLVVLIARFKPVAMTIVAGILMLLGIVGAYLGLGVAAVLAGLAGGEAKAEAGIGLALIVSIIYTVLGAYVGKKLIVKRTK
jgi:peptidoglycan/LPS O-acetylase OafA/YrhL